MSHLHEKEKEHEHAALPCDGEGHHHHHHEDGSCCCEQHAKEFHGIEKPMLIRLIVSAVLYLAAMLLPVDETAEMIMMICAALIAGYDIIWTALKNLLRARVFDEYFLMSFAAIAAFLIGEYEEAAVFVLYRIGAFCQSYAIRHSRRKIMHLTGDEELGEQDSRVRNRFIERFARIYTPVILALAVVIAVALPLIWKTGWHDAIYRALTFLVLACPCAVVISVPLAYFAGMSAASKKGIFFRDSAAIDLLSAVDSSKIELKSKNYGDNMAYMCEFQTKEGGETRFVLTDRDLILPAKRIARKTRLVAMENVWFTILVKLAVLVLSVCGISALWFAVFADSGVTVIVVLNALRAFYTGRTE